jgi:pimeloyl-ACP methyl ester carboxylesterase
MEVYTNPLARSLHRNSLGSAPVFHDVGPTLQHLTFPIRCHCARRAVAGDPTEFSVDEMVEDVHAAAIATGPGKIVLVGHSMGGRVAISYAAKYPEHIAALVIEDMDLRPRSTDWEKTPAVESFDRTFPSMEAAVDALSTVGGYGADRVQYWLGTRLRPTPTGGVWSDVNPQSRDLARKHVLETRDGWEAYTKLGHLERTSSGGLPFPVHLLVAGKGSACDDPDEMARLLPATQIHTFPMSGHSIHREARVDFMKLLHRIVFTAGNSKL